MRRTRGRLGPWAWAQYVRAEIRIRDVAQCNRVICVAFFCASDAAS